MLKALSKSNRYPVPYGDATFHFRALSAREFRGLEAAKDEKSIGTLIDLIRLGLVDWENVVVDDPAAADSLRDAGATLKPLADHPDIFVVEFMPEVLDVILDITDAGELLRLMVDGNKPSRAELGKSDSPAPSTPA